MFSKVFISTIIAGAIAMAATPHQADAQIKRDQYGVVLPANTLMVQGDKYGVRADGYGPTLQVAQEYARRNAVDRLVQLLLTKAFAPDHLRATPPLYGDVSFILDGRPIRGSVNSRGMELEYIIGQPTYVGGQVRVECMLVVSRAEFSDEFVRANAVLARD